MLIQSFADVEFENVNKKATCPATECSRDADVAVVLRAHKEG